MVVEKTKHAFVDDNPYLVYSGEPESTLDNAGGGSDSGNGSPFLYVTVNEELSRWTQNGIDLTISESRETIANAMQSGKMVIFVVTIFIGNYDDGPLNEQRYIIANSLFTNNSVIADFILFGPTRYYRIELEGDAVRGRQMQA